MALAARTASPCFRRTPCGPLGRSAALPLRRSRCQGPRQGGRGGLITQAVAEVYKSSSDSQAEALLCSHFKAHTSAVSACLVLEDSEERKQVITSSLDKTVALWQSTGSCTELCSEGYIQAARLQPPGGPVFCLARDARSQDGLPDQVYCGNHAKQVIAWVPPNPELVPNLVLDDHCGWVRSVCIAQGRWLFSCACNTLRQWDISRPVPRCVGTVALDKGDILALVASKDRVYAANADGSLRSWQIGKKGELTEVATRPKAHNDRITGITLRGNNFLYSVSYDGSVKAWDAASLELVMCAPAAHDGQRVHCLAVGPDKVLYTGGDDQLVRRWNPALLEPAADPLYCHNNSVRALAAGPRQVVVSGDKGGEVAVWKVV